MPSGDTGGDPVAGLELTGLANYIPVFLLDDGVPTAQGRQWADHMQRLSQMLKSLPALDDGLAGDAGQSFRQLANAPAVVVKSLCRRLHSQALAKVLRSHLFPFDSLAHGFAQPQVEIVHALGLFHQFTPRIPEPGGKMGQLSPHAFEGPAGGAGESMFPFLDLSQPVLLVG